MMRVVIEIQGNSEQDEINAAEWYTEQLRILRDKGLMWPHPEDARQFDKPFDSQLLTTAVVAERGRN